MNLAVKHPVVEEINDSWEHLKVGNNLFFEDIWDITPYLHNSKVAVASLHKLNFNSILIFPKVVTPIKKYFYLRLGEVKPMTVTNEYASLSSNLVSFMKENNLNSLTDFNTKIFYSFCDFLKEKYDVNKTQSSLALITDCLYKLLLRGQLFDFDEMPKEVIKLESSMYEYWGANALKKDYFNNKKSIPRPIWNNIINKAWAEDDFIDNVIGRRYSKKYQKLNTAKFGILIQAYTGLRISEVVYLKTGCVNKDSNGKCWLNTEISKTQTEPTQHQILIPQKIYELILKLDKISQIYRDNSNENNYLFYTLSRKNKTSHPVLLESSKWNWGQLGPFLKRNKIQACYDNMFNENIKITSHCFRHTYAQIAVAEHGVSATVLKEHFKHVSIEMTAHYVALSKNMLKKSYLKAMIDSNQIYTQGKEGNDFKNIINNAKVVGDLDIVVDSVSKLYGINPLPFGMCIYDFKRGNCPNLGVRSCYMVDCHDFVTNESFLDNFKNEKTILENNLTKSKKDGHVVEVKKIKYSLEKLQNIIIGLEK